MSKFFSKKYSALKAYVPGEQPKDMKYIKLNTNESPFPPPPSVTAAVKAETGKLQLYSDPECTSLTNASAELFGVKNDEIIMTNGSDEILNFAFMAFCDSEHPIVFPDITYGFYSVFAQLNGIPYEEIPLRDDFTVSVDDYCGIKKNIVIANPNAPTGISLSLDDIERIVSSNPDNVVIIDEAYVDFGGESAIPLIHKYSNLMVTGTFSKSRSMAGARLGFGIADATLIADIKTIKYSTNPYNINRMTMVAGYQAILANDYFMDNCHLIIKNREWTSQRLAELGFSITDSKANFIFAKHGKISGETLYKSLKARGVLVRHFAKPRISDYVRITVGTSDQMQVLVNEIKNILEEIDS